MANSEHVELLRRGVKVWNASRPDRPDLSNAKLVGCSLRSAYLGRANLSGANLTRANLGGTVLVQTNLAGADLAGCHVYGISAWDVKLSDGRKQQDLVITPPGEPEVTVDNIEVAQFVYLLLHNEKIRDVIDTVGRGSLVL
jgi:hypothetical protein